MAFAHARAEEKMNTVNEYIKVAKTTKIFGIARNTVRAWRKWEF